jgi:hypothetical protein
MLEVVDVPQAADKEDFEFVVVVAHEVADEVVLEEGVVRENL